MGQDIKILRLKGQGVLDHSFRNQVFRGASTRAINNIFNLSDSLDNDRPVIGKPTDPKEEVRVEIQDEPIAGDPTKAWGRIFKLLKENPRTTVIVLADEEGDVLKGLKEQAKLLPPTDSSLIKGNLHIISIYKTEDWLKLRVLLNTIDGNGNVELGTFIGEQLADNKPIPPKLIPPPEDKDSKGGG